MEQKNYMAHQDQIFPRGEKASADYFTGTAWVQMLVLKEDIFNCPIGNVIFEPGCRNNWHTHPAGQILICLDGEGYCQEKGQPIQRLKKGDVVQISPGIIHWHGATPDSYFTHLSISPNAQNGVVTWLEPVTDEEYNSIKK
ncbi:MAG: cupin domain-containing protein [Chitinophagaceae bacterium]